MSTATRLITEEEFAAMEFDVPVELVRGEILFLYGEDGMTRPRPRHGLVCANVAVSIGGWAIQTRAGRVVSNDSWITTTRNPDSVRGAAVAFYRMEQLAHGCVPASVPHPLVPALCVEVVSPSNRPREMQAKVDEYLTAGAEEVWVVDPDRLTVAVHRTDAPTHIVPQDALLTSRVLPDYSVQVATFFDGMADLDGIAR